MNEVFSEFFNMTTSFLKTFGPVVSFIRWKGGQGKKCGHICRLFTYLIIERKM